MADAGSAGRDDRFEWIDLEVCADAWWGVLDHPDLALRGTDGWIFYDCTPSDAGRVVLTYYRARERRVPHPILATGTSRQARPRSTVRWCDDRGTRGNPVWDA